jgi:hypothetical protein
METRDTTSVKLLAVDYDKCAFTLYSSHPQLLSPALIEYAKQGDYLGFYGCTHRSFSMLPILRKHAVNKAGETGHTVAVVEACFPTYQVTEHFEYHARLECLGVSMVDDLLDKACGDSFVEIVLPYEKYESSPGPEMKFVSVSDYGKYTKSKNEQLCQVAKDAVQAYPDMKITIDFIDDNLKLCQKALAAPVQAAWPREVGLRVFQHVANGDEAAITPVTAVAVASASVERKRKTALGGVGVFAVLGGVATTQPAVAEPSETMPAAMTGTHATRSGKKF